VTQLPTIDKGELSKKVIEDYFLSLIKTHKLSHSRSLVFFLCADDSMFEERKNAEAGVVGNFLGKIKRGVLPAEDWGVETERKIKVEYSLT
jgi:hypothetical protein